MNALPTVLRRLQALAAIRILLPRLGRWHVSCALSLLTALAVPANATTRNVPSQYATIGAAISAASSGDTILVADGTYTAQSILTSKLLTIQSVNGAGSTFLDGSNGNDFGTFQGNGTVIRGFTFENSTSSNGVINTQTSATVDQCIFQNNNSGFNFNPSCINTAGVSNTVTVSNCTFNNNTGLGAIEANSILIITGSTFTNNTGAFGSGAIYANTASGTISGCTFTGNQSDSGDQGGAIYWVNGSLAVTDSTFTNNSSNTAGGAVEIGAQGLDSPATLTRCLFSGNSASRGGALAMSVSSNHSTTVTATDCLFVNNSASNDGAAIAVTGNSVPTTANVINCSFYGNAYTGSTTGTGTIVGDGSATLTLTNTILYGDTTPNEISTAHSPSSITVSHSDIHGSGFLGTNGNIDADPLYVSPAAGDLKLAYNSPAINAGTTGASVPTTDYLSDTRDANPDIGAYEYLIVATPGSPIVTTQDQAFSGAVVTFADMSDSVAPVSGFSATINWGDGTPILPGTITQPGGAGTSYVVSGSHTYVATGPYAVTVSISTPSGVTSTATNAANVGPAVATHFVVSAPSTATAGTPINFTVTAEDALDVTVPGYSGTVHFTTSDRYGIVPADTTLKGGIGTFTATLGTVGTQTITATDTVTSSITGTSNNTIVSHGPAALFGMRAHGPYTIGTPFVFNVFALDIYGNLATDYTGTVHFSSSDPRASLPADATLTGGQGSFSTALLTAGSQTVTATDTVTTSITNTLTVTMVNNPTVFLRVNASPPTSVAGASTTIVVSAIDTTGTRAYGYNGTVRLTTADPNAVLPASATVVNGIGIFQVTFKTAGRYTVTVTDTTTSSLTGTSGTVTVSPGAATHLKATAQASAAANRPFGVVVQALDDYGNIATGYTGTIHLTSTDPSATLPANGVLYSGQRIFLATLKTLGGQTVTATDTTTSSLTATTGTVTITAH